jgi:hypothetical protein
MDGQRFDQITKTLATTGTRRSVLCGLAGGLVAALAGTRAGARAAKPPTGDCRTTGCKGNALCCNSPDLPQWDGQCIQCRGGILDPLTCQCLTSEAACTFHGGIFCPGPGKNGGECVVCPSGQFFSGCSVGCVACPMDPCPVAGQVRNPATCQCECQSGTQPCDGACIPTTSCCGGCTGGKTCEAGECVCPSAAPEECQDSCYAPCGEGQIRDSNTCQCTAGSCLPFPYGDSRGVCAFEQGQCYSLSCHWTYAPDGSVRCADIGCGCPGMLECESDAECAAGFVCVRDTCCTSFPSGVGRCAPAC